jgi:hypothetical protein
MLLGGHPDACTTGELKAGSMDDADQYRCSCRQVIKQCGFWIQIQTAMKRRGYTDFEITRAGTSIFEVPCPYAQRLLAPLYRHPPWETFRDLGLSLSPAWHRHLRSTQRRNLYLIESILEVTGAKWVIDSSKLALRLKYLLRIPELDIKIIRLIRDGRAVSLTYTDEWNFADSSDPSLRGGGTGQQRQPPRRNIAEAAREWKRSNESSDCLLATLPPSQWLKIHYEELCAKPQATLETICRFLGLDTAKVTLDFRAKTQHVIGNGMRLDTTAEIRLDERWKTHLTPEDLRIFDQVAGDLNRSYGYGGRAES